MDAEIVMRAIDIQHAQGLKKMTVASNALDSFKQIYTLPRFVKAFPPPEYDHDIRRAYKGGFTYVNPKMQRKTIGNGIVLDVNSLYPSVMYYNDMPYGDGVYFKGDYKEDIDFPLYIQMFECNFKSKKNHIPMIQIKGSFRFAENEYITDSKGEQLLCLSSVDLKLFFSHYDVWNITYHSGWKFRNSKLMFREYIGKWNGV